MIVPSACSSYGELQTFGNETSQSSLNRLLRRPLKHRPCKKKRYHILDALGRVSLNCVCYRKIFIEICLKCYWTIEFSSISIHAHKPFLFLVIHLRDVGMRRGPWGGYGVNYQQASRNQDLSTSHLGHICIALYHPVSTS